MASAPTDFELAEVNRKSAVTAPGGVVRDVVDYELLFDCVHCGLCLEACPTYVITRAEMDSPRGRIYLMKALAEGRLELDRDAVRHLDLCLDCRACETACPSGVRYGRLIERALGYVERNWQRRLVERVRNRLISTIFPYPARLRAVLAPLKWTERLGIGDLLPRLAPAAVRNWLDLLPAAKQQKPLLPAAAAQNADDDAGVEMPVAVVHQGCVAQVLTQSANLNSERALAAAGYRIVQLAKTVCCGALDIHHGNLERARKFARTNVEALSASGADWIVSAASGCAAVMAGYGELFKDEPKLEEQARKISARVTDLSSLLVARRQREPSPLPSRAQSPSSIAQKEGGGIDSAGEAQAGGIRSQFRATVTYHDSCHLVHGLGVREQPRELLRSIPGVRFVEMAESDMCCGSAGSYNLTEPAMARELARRKAGNIIATGADYVVLSNPGCEFQIAAELNRRGSGVHVLHLADFLAVAASHT